MSAYGFVCQEPRETRVRLATKMRLHPAVVFPVFKKLQLWNTGLRSENLAEFYRPDKTHWLIDDVGIAWSTSGPELEGHFVFWDGRLRGREQLVREMAKVFMEEAGTEKLVAFLPRSKTMLLRFLFRCGFTMESETAGMCKVYLLRVSV